MQNDRKRILRLIAQKKIELSILIQSLKNYLYKEIKRDLNDYIDFFNWKQWNFFVCEINIITCFCKNYIVSQTKNNNFHFKRSKNLYKTKNVIVIRKIFDVYIQFVYHEIEI